MPKINKSISKDSSVRQYTVRETINKWRKFSTVADLHKSGRPAKMSAKGKFSDVKKSL